MTNLCSLCIQLDFSAYRFRKRPLEFDVSLKRLGNALHIPAEYPNVEQSGFDGSLAGLKKSQETQTRHVSAVFRERHSCQLCQLFACAIEENGIEGLEKVEIHLFAFCRTIDNRDKEREVVRLSLWEWNPPAVQPCGPLPAFQSDKVASIGRRCLLQLQECAVPVPTASDGISRTMAAGYESDTRFSGRVVHPRADLKLFSQWLHRCEELHGESCGQSLSPPGSSQSLRDLFVVDVTKKCIVNAPENCQYVALSYCWGKAATLKHTLSNSRELQTPGSLSSASLPATIADAIRLVEGIEERFLWVDALCIIQDDLKAQAVQLAQMGLIYSLARLTLVAASGSDANSGLPGVRPNTRKIKQTCVHLPQKVLLEAIHRAHHWDYAQKPHWSTRAWTLQEEILSKRLLIFTDQQVYWSCWSAVWLEEVVLEDAFSVDFHANPLFKDPGEEHFSSLVRDGNIDKFYPSLVNKYRRRLHSFNSDILHAFSGICQVMSSISNENFFWGLQTSRFGERLSWCLDGGGMPNNAFHGSSDPPTAFPSWSWTGWHGTSGSSWIRWTERFKAKRRLPEIVFFCSKDGRLEEVEPSPAVTPRGNTAIPEEYEGHRGFIESPCVWNASIENVGSESQGTVLNAANLVFWTSSAILTIRTASRTESPSFQGYDVMEFTTTPRSDHALSMDVYDPTELSRVTSPCDHQIGKGGEFKVEFIVVSAGCRDRIQYAELYALAVVWRSGVAYRIGLLEVHESSWLALRNREWKRVVLG